MNYTAAVIRLRLATFLAALIALSGATAMPVRLSDLLRPAHTMSWCRAIRRESRVRRARAIFVSLVRRVVVAARPRTAAARGVALPFSLFQRPPPISA